MASPRPSLPAIRSTLGEPSTGCPGVVYEMGADNVTTRLSSPRAEPLVGFVHCHTQAPVLDTQLVHSYDFVDTKP